MTQQHGLVALALSPADVAGQGSEVGIFAAVGSHAEGASGRVALGRSVFISAALFNTSANYGDSIYGNVSLHSSLTLGGSLRWVLPEGRVRPFVEGGGWIVPHADLAFTRAYMNGAGVAIGRTDPGGSLSYYYGRLGAVLAAGGLGRFTLSGEIGRERLHTGRFDEGLDDRDPFEAHSTAGSDGLTIAKAEASVDHDLTSRLGFAVYGSYACGFNQRTSLAVYVPGIGTLSPSTTGSFGWGEYGASLNYRLTMRLTLSLFGTGVTGDDRHVGRENHGGIALRFGF